MYYEFDPITQAIIDMYEDSVPDFDTVPIGFNGVATERLTVSSNEISDDTIWFAFGVNFDLTTITDALIRISSRSPQYDWMSNDQSTPQDTPVGAVAGCSQQVLPMLPIVKPFFMYKNSKLQYTFTNSTTAPITGGLWTAAVIKLLRPKDGIGYQYGFSKR